MLASDLEKIIDIKYNEYKNILGIDEENTLFSTYSKFQTITNMVVSKFDDMFNEDGELSGDLSDEQIKFLLWHIPGGNALSNEEEMIDSRLTDDNVMFEDDIIDDKDVEAAYELVEQKSSEVTVDYDMDYDDTITETDVTLIKKAKGRKKKNA